MAGMHPVVPSTTMTVNLTKTIPVFSLSNDMIQSHGGHLGRGHSTLAMGPRLTGPRSGRNLSNLLVQPHWLHRWGQRGLTKLSHWTKTIELITGRGARDVLSPVGCWLRFGRAQVLWLVREHAFHETFQCDYKFWFLKIYDKSTRSGSPLFSDCPLQA